MAKFDDITKKGMDMPNVEKKSNIIKGFGAGNAGGDVKSHANDPFVLKKAKEAAETIKKVGLPGQKKK